MKIRNKLFLSFAFMIALLLTLALLSYDHSRQSQSGFQEMLEDGEFRYSIKEIQFRLAGVSNDERAYLLNGDAQFAAEITDKQKQARELLNAMKSNPTLDESDAAVIVQVEQAFDAYVKASQQVVSKMKEGKEKEAQTIHFAEESPIRKQLDMIVSQLLEKLEKEMTQDSADRQAETGRQNLLMLVIFAAAFITAVTIGLLLARSITRPLKAVNVQLREIAEGNGDLSREITLRSKDELAELAASFNRMVRNLRSIISLAKETSIQVAASSEQLTASAEQTTQATEQIVELTQLIASLSEKERYHVKEAVAAIQSMSEGIQQMSAGNEEVSRLSRSASHASSEGAAAVSEVLREMKETHETVRHAASLIRSLGSRSQEINGITGMITDLAGRTNLLALNASIEAARAGEHGKGFAVVAHEIRKLAEQSGQSAMQITGLIQETVMETDQAVQAMHDGTNKVTLSLTRAEEVDKLFQSIKDSVAAVTLQSEQTFSITGELAQSSQNIVAMVEEIYSASNEVGAACQSNSASTEEQLATMEEIASSSHALSKMAEELHTVLSRFRLQ